MYCVVDVYYCDFRVELSLLQVWKNKPGENTDFRQF